MKCVYCNGNTELKFESLNLLGGRLELKEQPYYHCLKCKREFVSSEQMKETEQQLNVFSILRLIVSTGRSLAITLHFDTLSFKKFRHILKIKIA